MSSNIENLHISQTARTSTQLLLDPPLPKAENNCLLSHRSDYCSNLIFLFSLFSLSAISDGIKNHHGEKGEPTTAKRKMQ